jgi:hypothetical protein
MKQTKIETYIFNVSLGNVCSFTFTPNLSFTPSKCIIKQINFIGVGSFQELLNYYSSLGGGNHLGTIISDIDLFTSVVNPKIHIDLPYFTNIKQTLFINNFDNTVNDSIEGSLSLTIEFKE